MALPLTRNRTYTSGDPVVSADLDDIQDQIIALQAGARSGRTQHLAPIGEKSNVNWNATGYINSTGVGTFERQLDVQEGERIKSIGLEHYGNGANDIILRLYHRTSGSPVEVHALTVSAPPASWDTTMEDLATPEVVGVAGHYYLAIAFTTSGLRACDLIVQTDVVP